MIVSAVDGGVVAGDLLGDPGGEWLSGRKASPVASSSVAEELRLGREELGLTLREVARRTGISPSFLSQLERGRRVPSLATYERLRAFLGVELSQDTPGRQPLFLGSVVSEELLRSTAARLIADRETSLPELARAVGARAVEVRAALGVIGPRLAAVGFRLAEDGGFVRLLSLEGGTEVGRERLTAARQSERTTRHTVGLPVLIGRDQELAELLETVRRPPAIALVEGEAGIGKSRLVTELLDRPELAGIRTVVAAGDQLSEPFPLGPVLDALHGLRDLPPAGAFSPVVGALRPLLPELVDRLPSALAPLGDPKAERHRVFRALREVLGALGPTVFVMEDFHFVDPASGEFLRFLAKRLPPTLALVVTYCREDLPEGSAVVGLAARLGSGVAGARIGLAPLSVEQVGRLLEAVLGDRVSAELAASIHERSAGIPFGVEELARRLGDCRELMRGGGTWVRRALAEIEVPGSVRDSVLERASRLPLNGRRVAEAAAALGVPASETLLRSVAGLRAGQARLGLRACLKAGVLVEVGADRHGFRHALAREAVYGTLTRGERQRVHLRAARALAGSHPQPVAQLARHYRHANRPRLWLRFAEAAAELASVSGDDAIAARLLYEALEGVRPAPTVRARLALKLGRAALQGHAYQREAIGTLRGLLEAGPRSLAAGGEVRSVLGMLLIETGEAALGHRELARSVPELRRRPELAALVMVNLALPTSVEGSQAEHRRWLERATDAAAGQENPTVKLTVAAARGLIPLYFGDPIGWEALAELPPEGGSLEEQRQRLWLSAHLLGACFHLGHDQRARSYLADAERRAERLGWGRLLPIRENATLLLAWAGGEWPGLEKRAERMAEAMVADYPAGALVNQAIAASLALARGDRVRAERSLLACKQTARATGLIAWLVTCSGWLARSALARGDADGACRHATDGLEVIFAKRLWPWAAEIVPVAVEAMLAPGRQEDAGELVGRFARGLRGRDAPLAAAALCLCRGLLAQAQGQHAQALRAFELAERRYGRLPRPYEAAGAAARAGCCRLAAGDHDGGARVLDALSRFEQLGAAADAGQLRQALRQAGISVPRRGGRRAYGDELSPRESDVARLAAGGLSASEIAPALAISPSTVHHHLASAVRKLGLGSKADLAEALAAGSVCS